MLRPRGLTQHGSPIVSDPHPTFLADFHAHRTRDPNACVRLGVEARLDELPDPSLSAASAALASAKELLARCRSLPKETLSPDEVLDLDLAALMLEREVHDHTFLFNGRTTRQQLPTAGDDISDGLYTMLVNDPRPAEERLANVTARLEMVPDYVEALLRTLHCPVQRWAEVDRDKVEGLPALFDNLLAWARREAFADLPRLEKAQVAAKDALSSYLERLGALETVPNLFVGEATARRIVELRGIELSLEGLHRVARSFLAELRAMLEELRGRLTRKYDLPADATVEAVHAHLNRVFAVSVPDGRLERVLRRYEAERDKVSSFIDARGLFPIPDAQSMRILQTPPFLEPTIPAGAMTSPAPFREGERISLVYLTLSEALLDEHTELGIPGMMIHEGIPGHHLQMTWGALHPSMVRRHVDAMDQAEGWTTMLEDYMLDVGYMGDLTDEARFIGKLDIARIGARVGIDLYFMTGDPGFLDLGVEGVSPATAEDEPFEAAGALLGAVTGFTPGRVQAELNWYSMERGYPLSYLAGNHEVWRLKREVEDADNGLSGEALDRRFHSAFLEAGCMPMKYLRRVFRREGLI